jgi:hypothetical protein
LLDAADQIFRQIRRTFFGLIENALGLAREGPACPEGKEAYPGCGENQPARPAPTIPVAFALDGIGYVGKTFAHVNDAIGELVDICHLGPPFQS